jgi:hypothetical protein
MSPPAQKVVTDTEAVGDRSGPPQTGAAALPFDKLRASRAGRWMKGLRYDDSRNALLE